MFSTTLWLMCLALESVLLLRAVQANILKHYPFFYIYVACILIRDALLMPVYYLWPKIYGFAYWYSRVVIVVMGCVVVWEVYKIALSRYPGAARMARNVIPFLFIFSISRLLVKVFDSPNWIPGRTTLETERDLRIVQMALLLGLIALFAYYAIPLRRELKGIIYGFSVSVATILIHLTLRDQLGKSFQQRWEYIQPTAYIFVLLIWCATLWSYERAPELETNRRLEVDYQSLAGATKRQLRAAHSYIWKAIRS